MQARTRSSSLSAVSKARTHGEGYGTTSVGCMGGSIHTDLRGTFAGDLNNCRGWDGGIGVVKKVISQKQPREYYSRKVLLGKARLAMVYVTKVTCRIKDT
jgi:hypothetical protein